MCKPSKIENDHQSRENYINDYLYNHFYGSHQKNIDLQLQNTWCTNFEAFILIQTENIFEQKTILNQMNKNIPHCICENQYCGQGPVIKVCKKKDCPQNRLICNNHHCGMMHQTHDVISVEEAISFFPTVQQNGLGKQAELNAVIDQKVQEFYWALKQQITIKGTSCQSQDFSHWSYNDLKDYATNLSQVDQNSQRDIETDIIFENIRNFNVVDFVNTLKNSIDEKLKEYKEKQKSQNLSNAFQPQPQESIPPKNKDQKTWEDLLKEKKSQQNNTQEKPKERTWVDVLAEQQMAKSHKDLQFNQQEAYQNYQITNNTFELKKEMNTLVVLPQNLLQMKDNQISLVLQVEGGSVSGEGKNKFGLYFGNLNQSTYDENSHAQNLIVMSDNGTFTQFGANAKQTEFKIDNFKNLISITLDKVQKQLSFLNQDTKQKAVVPITFATQTAYFCVILQAGTKQAKVEIK